MVVTVLQVTHQPQDRRLEVLPGENQTVPGFFKYTAMSSNYRESPIIFQHIRKNIHLIPHLNKRLNAKQPTSFHFPVTFSHII
jgi:hypothetical protein